MIQLLFLFLPVAEVGMWTEPEDAGTHIRRHTFGTSGVLVSLDLAQSG